MSRLAGHALVSEGAAHDDAGRALWVDGRRSGPGRGKCECGTLSDRLASARQRQQWHQAHKAEVATANGAQLLQQRKAYEELMAESDALGIVD